MGDTRITSCLLCDVIYVKSECVAEELPQDDVRAAAGERGLVRVRGADGEGRPRDRQGRRDDPRDLRQERRLRGDLQAADGRPGDQAVQRARPATRDRQRDQVNDDSVAVWC